MPRTQIAQDQVEGLVEALAEIKGELARLKLAIQEIDRRVFDPTEAFKALDARIKKLEGKP